MAIVTSRSDLTQGASNVVTDAVFGTGTGADINITSAGNELPALATDEMFEIRGHSNTQNNGLYKVVTVTGSTNDYECDKVNGSAPITASAEEITTLGETGLSTEKSVFFDTAGLGVYILEQGNVSADGASGPAVYPFIMQEWKDDSFLIKAAPFPITAIDNDAGKYVIGQDPGGNNNGWNWVDDAGFSIRTRKLLRNMGWDEVNSSGITTARYFGALSVDAVEDPANDTAYYMFGTDTTVDNTVDFDFAGPVNEAVQFFEEIGNPATCDFATSSTITRATGSFITEGYVVGGQVTVRNADNAAHDGTYVLTGVAALTLTVTGTPFTGPDADTNAILAVNNANAVSLRLRVRDGDDNGKTFAQANLVTINKPSLGNFVFQFPLANATDLKITETDANIDGNAPYDNMTITFYDTPQARAGLIGGSYNFGIIVDGNNGTNIQVSEFVQRQLRKITDIDNDGDTAIGRSIDGLLRFVGDDLEVGSINSGVTFPVNPDGGGSGVFVDNLNAASKNNTFFYDNTGSKQAFPEAIPVTLDFNAILIDDGVAEYDLFYDRTIRTSVTDFVLTNATSKMTSTGAELPTNSEIGVGKYVRVAGLTGDDAPMNGTYQITAITTSGEDWTVIRYDGLTIVDVVSTTINVDQNCINTPDAIIVHTDIAVTNTDIGFTSPDTIASGSSEFGVFSAGDKIEISGTTGNDGIYTIDTVVAGTITTIEQTLLTETSGPSITISQAVTGLADIDKTFSYAFDNNTQGGRTVSTNTYVKAKAVGAATAQYTESTVQLIESGVPITIPLTSPTERNYI